MPPTRRPLRTGKPTIPCSPAATAAAARAPTVRVAGGGGLERRGVAAGALPRDDERHRLTRQIDLPVLGELPVEGAAKSLEHSGRGLLPARRRHERLRDCEARGLQNLGTLAVADVHGHGLEVARPPLSAADE